MESRIDNTLTFLLLHGAWHDGSAWDQVAEHLRRKQHRVHAPTLAGHGDDDRPSVTFDDIVDGVVDLIRTQQLRDVVLVGHSMSGIVASLVAQRVPDAIARVVYLAAFILKPNNCLLDEVPPPIRESFSQLRDSDNRIMIPYELWRDGFIGDATEDLAREVYGQLRPEPMALFETPAAIEPCYKMLAEGTLRASYVLPVEDVSLPPGEWSWYPRFPARLPGVRLVTMPGSHEVMYTAPELLAEKVVVAGRP